MRSGKNFEREASKIYHAAFGHVTEGACPREADLWYEVLGDDGLLKEFHSWVQTQTRATNYPLREFFMHLQRNGTGASAPADNPEVKKLLNDISDRSNGVLIFRDQQKIKIAACLKDYSAEIILKAADQFMETVVSDANRKYAPKDFSETLEQLAYAVQRRMEREKQELARRAEIEKKLLQEAQDQQAQEAAEKAIRDTQRQFDVEHADDLGSL